MTPGATLGTIRLPPVLQPAPRAAGPFGLRRGAGPALMIQPFQALACPLDGAALQRHGATWRCAAGHSFDIASQGYANLLPVQYKRSKDPGDSKEMIAARRRYLESGVYRPIAAATAQAALADLAPDAPAACLDAGCGEGYYLRELAAAAPPGLTLEILGLDISKWAVQAAARQEKRATWVVGTNARLPVRSASLDRLLCLFGFPVHAEFARVLRPGGRIVQVDAGPDHLRELREIIYPRLKDDPRRAFAPPAGFALLSEDTLRYPARLTSRAQIADLLTMTPHLYRATAEGRARAAALDGLDITVDVRIALLARSADDPARA